MVTLKPNKSWLILGLGVFVLVVASIAGCLGGDDDEDEEGNGDGDGNGGFTGEIVVVGRDSASGTRATFEELVDCEDACVDTMQEKQSNGQVVETVKGNELAIGYVGLGYLGDDGINGLKIDGVMPSTETVLDGSYPISRNLNYVTNGEATGLAQAFIQYTLGEVGQEKVEAEDFVPLTPGDGYTGGDLSGTLTITGSTTVLPIAQAVADAFMEDYPDVEVIVSGGGSSVGVAAATEGTADIGMASREIKDSEMDEEPDLVATPVAKDGIALIVHKDNPTTDMALNDVTDIYTGEIANWEDL